MKEVLDVVLQKRVGAVRGSVTMETTCVTTPIEFELKHFGKGEKHRVFVKF